MPFNVRVVRQSQACCPCRQRSRPSSPIPIPSSPLQARDRSRSALPHRPIPTTRHSDHHARHRARLWHGGVFRRLGMDDGDRRDGPDGGPAREPPLHATGRAANSAATASPTASSTASTTVHGTTEVSVSSTAPGRPPSSSRRRMSSVPQRRPVYGRCRRRSHAQPLNPDPGLAASPASTAVSINIAGNLYFMAVHAGRAGDVLHKLDPNGVVTAGGGQRV